MAQQQSTERPVYTYTPGDGHRYVWHGTGDIDVHRVADILADPGAAPVDKISTATGDGQPAFPRTVTGFTGYVDTCRGAR